MLLRRKMNARRRSLGLPEYGEESLMSGLSSLSSGGYSSCSSSVSGCGGSPVSRRRSMSPLCPPLQGQPSATLLMRNRKEPSFPQTETEQLVIFQERILWKQEKALLPLAHDLSDWINATLGNPNNTPAQHRLSCYSSNL